MSKTYTQLIMAASIVIAGAGTAAAMSIITDHNWNVANGDWTFPSNWNPTGAPGTGDTAIIAGGICTLDADVVVGGVTISSPGKLNLNAHSITFDPGGGIVNGGIVEVSGSCPLIGDLTNNSGGVFNLFGGSTFRPSGGAFVNDGVIRLNTTASSTATLEFAQSQTVNGTGSIQLLFPTNADLKTVSGAVLTNGVGHTIRGRGFVIANLINNGTIKGDSGTTDSLVLTGGPMVNNNEIVTASGTVKLQDVNMTQGGAGTISAANGHVLLSGIVSISGGTFASSGGSAIQNHGTSTLTNVTNSGSLDLIGGTTVKLAGTTFVNNGIVRLNTTASATAFLQAIESLTVNGTGSIQLLFPTNAEINTVSGATLTNGAGHTIRGRGFINASLINNGTIKADPGTVDSLVLTGGPMTNNNQILTASGTVKLQNVAITQSGSGTITASNGNVVLLGSVSIAGGTITSTVGSILQNQGTTTLSNVTNLGQLDGIGGTTVKLGGTTFVNNGSVRLNTSASATAFLEAIENVTMSGTGSIDLLFPTNSEIKTATGKTLTNAVGHRIKGRGIVRGQINNQGSILADFSGETMTFEPSGSGITNNGTVQIGPGLATLNNASLFTTAGTLSINNTMTANGGNLKQTGGTTNVASTLTISGGNDFLLEGGVLKGSGTVAGDVNNSDGEVQPGSSPGKLRVQGSYTQGEEGKLTVEIGGETQISEYDLLQVTGAANLDGTLRIEVINGFTPPAGSSFTVLTCASRSGAFDAVELMGTPGGAVITYNATNVVVSFEQGAVVGTVNLEDWSVSPAGQLVTFELWQGATLVETISNVPLDASGNYSFTTAQRGTFEISAKCSHWLRQRRAGSIEITNAGASGVNFSLINGDTDPDNEVNLVDFGVISSTFGFVEGDPGFNPMADLDGDGEVNLLDFAIMSSNFGLTGDE